ncbi:hypothetical protein AB0I49_27870 [Streptomyces sp. NPDC050617]|uniref:hypothetical protein n=1 Tax=Streptomyces sp. NPDC050617 TaxID=3154628 RepID=UPI00341564F1
MRTLFSGEAFVHYGQIYVESGPDWCMPELEEAFAGQEAGLCGAGEPGALWLMTGLHTGNVGFTVEWHEGEPPLDSSWEEAVEVSFRPLSSQAALVQWAGEDSWDLDLQEIDYRVRYCATGMDEAREAEAGLDEGPAVVDRYLLQFWPSPPGPARLVRQTSSSAAYWHEYARELPPPPTPEERAEAERAARLEAERERVAAEKAAWGGWLPSENLRRVGGNVRRLVEFDAGLVHAIDTAGGDRQRAVARLAARRAYDVAGLAELDWAAPALAALDQGRPLPAPFDDRERVWDLINTDERVPQRTVRRAVPPGQEAPSRPSGSHGFEYLMGSLKTHAIALASSTGGPGTAPPVRMSQPHMAVPALLAAAEPDPLPAALETVYAAVTAYGEDYRRLLDEVWAVARGD